VEAGVSSGVSLGYGVFQFKESSRYKNIEEKSVEAKTSDIGHESREVGRKTSSGRVKIKCAVRVI
jgi:hypothetical protein